MTDKRVLLINEDGTAEVNGVRVRVVPVEPTEAMNTNGASAYENALDDGARWQRAAMYCYRAMLSAATLDLSALPGVPERSYDTHGDWNSALDAMGVK